MHFGAGGRSPSLPVSRAPAPPAAFRPRSLHRCNGFRRPPSGSSSSSSALGGRRRHSVSSGSGSVFAGASSGRRTREMTIERSDSCAEVPKIVAFDLDATLWYPEMYMLGGPPFRLATTKSGGRGRPVVVDRTGEEVELLGQAWEILDELATDPKWAGTQVAFVSRTDMPGWANKCLNLFKLPNSGLTLHQLAIHHEIYPGCKRTHFKRIHERTNIPYDEMLFFDDWEWNLEECAVLGVHGVHTPRGLTEAVWRKGLKLYAERRATAAAKAGRK